MSNAGFDLLLITLAGGLVTMLMAWAITMLLHRAAAATRHAVWIQCCACALVLPVAAMILPTWTVPVGIPSVVSVQTMGNGARAIVQSQPGVASRNASTPSPGTPVRAVEGWESPSPANLIVAIWLLGCVILVTDMLIGHMRVRHIMRETEVVHDDRVQEILRACEREGGIRRPVDIRSTRAAVVPYIHGLWRQVIVVPAQAVTWSTPRLRVVFAHELAHARRGDALNALIIRLARALHWPNPFVWLAVRKAQYEMECACDDAVLATQQDVSSYALELLDLARSLSPIAGSRRLAVMHAGGLEARIASMLDDTRSHILSPTVARRCSVAFACAVVLLSSARVGTAASIARRPPAAPRSRAKNMATRVPPTIAPREGAPVIRTKTGTAGTGTAASPDSLVVSLPTLAGVCGRGVPDEITFSRTTLQDTEDCKHGAATIVVSYAKGTISDVHAVVGGAPGSAGVLDASRMSAVLAAVPTLDGRAASRAIQAMALSSVASAPQLLALAKDDALAPEARRMAVTWFDIVAGAEGRGALVELARDATTDLSVREQAIIALDDAKELASLYPAFADEKLRRRIVNSVAVSGDASAVRSLVNTIERESESSFRTASLDRLARAIQ